jgi:hypothetical protein
VEKTRDAVRFPILSSSAAFLRLLLQDGAVDLELASSVVALDPGLAFGTLQLANRELPDGTDRLWQLPSAVVTAGREGLEQLLEDAPLVESCGNHLCVAGLRKVIANSVSRACVAHLLTRELGSSNASKCYLSGLLFDLPALTRRRSPDSLLSSVVLLSSMCRSLPAVIVRLSLAQPLEEPDPSDPLIAIVLIADRLVRATDLADAKPRFEELSTLALWHRWESIPTLQRAALLKRCCGLLSWASANLYKLNPWEFLARLERRKSWE